MTTTRVPVINRHELLQRIAKAAQPTPFKLVQSGWLQTPIGKELCQVDVAGQLAWRMPRSLCVGCLVGTCRRPEYFAMCGRN